MIVIKILNRNHFNSNLPPSFAVPLQSTQKIHQLNETTIEIKRHFIFENRKNARNRKSGYRLLKNKLLNCHSDGDKPCKRVIFELKKCQLRMPMDLAATNVNGFVFYLFHFVKNRGWIVIFHPLRKGDREANK